MMRWFFRSGKRRRALAAVFLMVPGMIFAVRGWAKRGQDAPEPLPTGRAITPPGTQTDIGSFPANMIPSPDGKFLVVTNTGFRQFLSVLSADDGHLVSQLPFNANLPGESDRKTALYFGLAFASNATGTQTLYVSRGPEDKISIFTLDTDGKLTDTGRALQNPSHLPKEAGPNFLAGLALNSDGTRCYVANNETSAWTKQKGSVSILDTATGSVLGSATTPGFPLAVAALTKGTEADSKLYVTSERDGVVTVVRVKDPAHPKAVRNITTGDHPDALLMNAAQTRLYVANAGSDTISIIDTLTDTVRETIPLRPEDVRGLAGATPTGLALSPDETTLYVTLADMNAIAIVRLDGVNGTVQGYTPAGWYPTSVSVSRDGTHLFVANAKGMHPRNPNNKAAGPNGAWGKYIQSIIEGTVSVMPVPRTEDLPTLTAQVLANNRLTNFAQTQKNGLPDFGAKHVIYIIKENRTYDQVLGDLPQGNGDASQVLFGRDVTPNLHALAERFLLLDNFYCCAEVSADGWDWSTSGMISEYTARNTPFNYSGRGRSYDFEGETNGVAVDRKGIPDVARAPGGYLWDRCAEKGVSYRNYGFYVVGEGGDKGPNGKPLGKPNTPTKKALVGHTDEDFLQFALDYADSDAWKLYNNPAPKQRQSYGKHGAPSRFSEWKREFDGYVKSGQMPQFMMIRFMRDHTAGTSPGLQSPRGMVADNDYAVGQLVEAVSHSPFWNDTIICVLEDDAQAGNDHVDAHRSTAYVIGPRVRRGTVDHRFYNTDSMLRTMENILGLSPLCQYDAVAPIFDCFSTTPDNSEPYTAILPDRKIIGEFNTRTAYRAKDSLQLNFRHADRVPDAVLNDIVWHAVKGAKTPEPVSRHGLRLSAAHTDMDD